MRHPDPDLDFDDTRMILQAASCTIAARRCVLWWPNANEVILARRRAGTFPAVLREGNLPVLPAVVPILYCILCIPGIIKS